MKIPQIKIKEETIYDNGKRKVLLKTFKTSDGTQKEIPISSGSRSSISTMTLVLGSSNNIYYGKEYRDGPEIFVNNFSAGKLEPGLTYEDNVGKELHEELGVISSEITYLGETIVAAYENTILKYYIATNCEFGEQNLDQGENFEIQSCKIKEFEQKVIYGEINCPQTITCYTLAKLKKLI